MKYLNYNNHDLTLANKLSDYHYICNKCNSIIYFTVTGSMWVIDFSKVSYLERIRADLENLTCEEIIIKNIIE